MNPRLPSAEDLDAASAEEKAAADTYGRGLGVYEKPLAVTGREVNDGETSVLIVDDGGRTSKMMRRARMLPVISKGNPVVSPASLPALLDAKADAEREKDAAFAKVRRMIPKDEMPLRVGNKWVNMVTITLVLPRGKRMSSRFHARRGAAFTEKGLNDLLDRVATNLEQSFPGVDFRLVEVRTHQQFNIIHPAAEKRADSKQSSSLAGREIGTLLSDSDGHGQENALSEAAVMDEPVTIGVPVESQVESDSAVAESASAEGSSPA